MKNSGCYLAIMIFSTVGLFIWLFGAGGYDSIFYGESYIAQRKSVWKAAVMTAIPLGSTRPQIQEWAEQHSFSVYEAPDKRTLEIVVQKIPYHQIVCSDWKIIAEIWMKDAKAIREDVVSMGACL
jgi:hypothetical protein